ncbi:MULTISPECIES: UPF0147 family protein [Sulfuracidifex]|jgi:uncharacterized protein (UPF0147 family)|uniref:UPF0147 protein GC250_01080 n=2 Tax=Sulfuracidifex TaxID=2705406 RepID=A0A6A9QG73_SULME|nr:MULTISPECIES: UPF0147 family protein [Sulfuracidifex]MCY0849997.1 UPF0147 family protein [Sulfuracidifex metallicus]MUN28086.1 hypothetical protein [Sulfuracidifex metallicus DSM 6482 = JCM 9184]WOE51370.1 UPF0147 family protein [Sulfuracidifex metallicus DSM 6482 = JCM 9184]BBG23967.1 hypothetical protein IC006_1265 [Sulfuracidifex tepidarius]BBG26722.1 hypothetical protein IC007_1240 [Sulfuracidifex tepidarius]
MASPYDNEAKLKQAVILLQKIVNDTSVPRNIRRAATDAIRNLQDNGISHAVRAANAIGILEDISQDPNMPMHARISIWNVVSVLETIRD